MENPIVCSTNEAGVSPANIAIETNAAAMMRIASESKEVEFIFLKRQGNSVMAMPAKHTTGKKNMLFLPEGERA